MLKITVIDVPAEQKWVLQGQLTGSSVSELMSSWAKAHEARKGRKCVVDLENVTFIDEEGENVLLAMMQEHAFFVASGVYTKELLKTLRGKSRRPLCRFLGRLFLIILCCAGAIHPLRAQDAASQNQSLVSSAVSSVLGTQSPFLGSLPSGKATGTVVSLSIRDALERGLRYNLGVVESDIDTRAARAERLKSLSELLPDINVSLAQTVEQINLKAQGLNFNVPGIPMVVGPFGVQDARGYLSQKVFDWNAVQKFRASTEHLR
ncbi:MAG TPA: hypothetical protein VE398_16920, partial [Acidobacteriota bacterium]|nr:hypothetical protein [Acidobacteriota bacterium]